jgi:hypothetical protein
VPRCPGGSTSAARLASVGARSRAAHGDYRDNHVGGLGPKRIDRR